MIDPRIRPWLRIPLLGALALASWTVPVAAQGPTPEEAAVLDIAQEFLEALSDADTAKLSPMLMTGAMLYSVREGSEGPSTGVVSRQDFLDSLGGDGQEFLERMWDPVAKVDGHVAMVWTPYDFHLNGAFSHCGVDVFTFLRGSEGWQVASITYNVVRDGCTPSPLGPPKGV